MIIYLIVFALLLFPCIRYDFCGRKGGESIWYQVCLWTLILLAAFRYRTGGDTLNYLDLFKDYPKISELNHFDFASAEFFPMWYVVNSVFKSFGNSFFLFQLVESVFVNVVIFRFLYRYCRYFFLAVVIYYFGYYFYFNMEILREIICICLFLIAYPLLEEKRYLPYFAIMVLALTFHVSAIAMLMGAVFLALRKERLIFCIVCCIGMVAVLLKFDIIDIVLTSFFGQEVSLVRQYLAIEQPNLTGALVTFLNVIPFLMIFYLREKQDIHSDEKFGAMLNSVILVYCLGMFVRGPVRLTNYFMLMGMVFVINTLMDNWEKIRSSQYTTVFVMGTLFLYFFNLSFFYLKSKDSEVRGVHVYDRYVPYVSVFNPYRVDKRERLVINEHYHKELEINNNH